MREERRQILMQTPEGREKVREMARAAKERRRARGAPASKSTRDRLRAVAATDPEARERLQELERQKRARRQERAAADPEYAEQLREKRRIAEEHRRERAAADPQLQEIERVKEQQRRLREKERAETDPAYQERLREQERIKEERRRERAAADPEYRERLRERKRIQEQQRRQRERERAATDPAYQERLREQERIKEERRRERAAADPEYRERLREQRRLEEKRKRERRRERAASDPEYRERLRTQERLKEERRQERAAAALDIVAVDGEGVTLPDGRHAYVLLAASTGAFIENPEGLTTEEALDFLLSLSGGQEKRRLVSFAFAYDANKILSDLSHGKVSELYQDHTASWSEVGLYWLQYLSGHYLAVTSRFVEFRDGEAHEEKRTAWIWDIYRFFKSSFVSALEEWEIGAKEERSLVAAMKGQRESFTPEKLPEMRRYCLLECRLLAQLARRLDDTRRAAELPPLARWDGSGAIASALLQRYGVKDHLPPARQDEPSDAIRGAYYGGRQQALAVGKFDCPAWHYDIHSAYPSVMADLPGLAGRWVPKEKYQEGEQWAVWRVLWDIGESPEENPHWPLTPFPWRMGEKDDSAIVYPCRGVGWYWAPLVAAARKAWPGKVKVLEGYVFKPTDPDARPFAWVRDLYDRRRQYRADGDPRERVLKLALNSLYGKTAQGIGYAGSTPPYQSYVWAGLTTATVQARLLEAALLAPRSVVAMAVDGLFSLQQLPLPTGPGLGQWDEHPIDSLFLVGAGTYEARQQNGSYYRRSQGFRPDEYPWEKLKAGWDELGTFHKETITIRRFVPMGVALSRGELESWGQWDSVQTDITCFPGHGFDSSIEGIDGPTPGSVYWQPVSEACDPGEPWQAIMPRPYRPKNAARDTRFAETFALEVAEEQPEPIV